MTERLLIDAVWMIVWGMMSCLGLFLVTEAADSGRPRLIIMATFVLSLSLFMMIANLTAVLGEVWRF